MIGTVSFGTARRMLALVAGLVVGPVGWTAAQVEAAPLPTSPDLQLEAARVAYHPDLDLLVFEQQVAGSAGNTVPRARGRLDGAPVLAYVFPTTLEPAAVSFGTVEGILALVVTSHPDFDDTPLWDEDNDGDPNGDGRVYHSHWVVLIEDERVPGGLAVREFAEGEDGVQLPPTHPGMPLYLDSPGFAVVLQGDSLKVLVPAQRVSNQTSFNFDAVTAYLQVNTSDPSRPMLAVYQVYSVLSGDLSLPFEVEQE